MFFVQPNHASFIAPPTDHTPFPCLLILEMVSYLFVQLLLYLKKFSSNIISRTTELEKQVDALATETKGTDTRMNNVFNDFLMLSNIQFVENVSIHYSTCIGMGGGLSIKDQYYQCVFLKVMCNYVPLRKLVIKLYCTVLFSVCYNNSTQFSINSVQSYS